MMNTEGIPVSSGVPFLIRLCKEITYSIFRIVNYRPTVDRERTSRFALRRSDWSARRGSNWALCRHRRLWRGRAKPAWT